MNNTPFMLRDITKTYPGVVALQGVSMQFAPGRVHAIVGENGAGKSTLIKTISGAVIPDAGILMADGMEYAHITPKRAKPHGIEVIYQEFNLVETMSAAENIFLGDRLGRRFSQKLANEKARVLCQQFHNENQAA